MYVNWIDSIRTKQPVETQGSEAENVKVYGNDPIEIVKDWVSVAEDGYVTLRIRTLWGGNATHIINLVNGVNKDNVYEFDLRHNAQGDTNGKNGRCTCCLRPELSLEGTAKSGEDKAKLAVVQW